MVTDIYRQSKKDGDSAGGNLKNAVNYANSLNEKVRKTDRINLTIHMKNNAFGFGEMFQPDGVGETAKRGNTVSCLMHNSVAIAVHRSELTVLYRRNPLGFQ